MSTEKNNDIVRKRQEALDAKQNEIVENLDNVSLKEVKESKKEANVSGDSDREQIELIRFFEIFVVLKCLKGYGSNIILVYESN